MKYSTNYNMDLPEIAEQYNIKHMNKNTEIIDKKLNEFQTKLDASTSEKTPSTLMSRDEAGKVKVTTPAEQDDSNMAVNIDYLMNAFRTKILDESHPKGSYYYTDDKNFNPNVSWVGSWVRVENSFIYAIPASQNADGVIRGSKKIEPANLPPHTHVVSASGTTTEVGSHRHWVFFNGQGEISSPLTNALGKNSEFGNLSNTYLTTRSSPFDQANSGLSSEGGSHTHTVTVAGGTDGGPGQSADYMPPHIGAYCWHRTA